MLEQKIKRNTLRNQGRQWLILGALSHHMTRAYQQFRREVSVQSSMRKNLFAIKMISIRFKRGVRRNGPNMEERTRRSIKTHLTALGGSLVRTNLRERAKHVLKSFLTESYEQDTLFAKVRKTYETLNWMQRLIRMNYIMKKNKHWYGEVETNATLAAAGMRNLWLAFFRFKCKKAQEQIDLFEARFDDQVQFTKEHKVEDAEMLDIATKTKIEESAERRAEEVAENDEQHK